MSDLLDLASWRLSTGDLIQQMAAFMWLHKGDDYKQLYTTVTGARVTYELYSRLSDRQDIESLRNQCIMSIVEFVKSHPKASEAELTKEVERQIATFKELLNSL
jgi:hypothetical protein